MSMPIRSSDLARFASGVLSRVKCYLLDAWRDPTKLQRHHPDMYMFFYPEIHNNLALFTHSAVGLASGWSGAPP